MTVPITELCSDTPALSQFEQSFTGRYLTEFSPEERQEHAKICARRPPGGVSVGLVPSDKQCLTSICLNAEDALGMLSLASATLSTLGYEIQEALAFARETPSGKPSEILDIFWLKDPSKIICQEDARAISNLLSEYLAGRPAQVARLHSDHPSRSSGTAVRFLGDNTGDFSILEVETADRFGLLWDVARVLTSCGVQILASEIRTRGVRVIDRFTIEELSGDPILAARRLELQTAVLSALES